MKNPIYNLAVINVTPNRVKNDQLLFSKRFTRYCGFFQPVLTLMKYEERDKNSDNMLWNIVDTTIYQVEKMILIKDFCFWQAYGQKLFDGKFCKMFLWRIHAVALYLFYITSSLKLRNFQHVLWKIQKLVNSITEKIILKF